MESAHVSKLAVSKLAGAEIETAKADDVDAVLSAPLSHGKQAQASRDLNQSTVAGKPLETGNGAQPAGAKALSGRSGCAGSALVLLFAALGAVLFLNCA